MSFFGCYEAVDVVLGEAVEQFGNKYKVNQEEMERIAADCRIVDAMVEEFNCEALEAEITDDLDITVCVECDEMTLENGRSHPFFTLIQHTKWFSFKSIGEDKISVTFNLGCPFLVQTTNEKEKSEA